MYNTILFDLDGTLTDPKEGITKCVQYALKKSGIIEENLDNLLPFIGPPLVNSFIKFYNMTEEEANLALGYYRERFTDVGMFENSVIDGIPEMLDGLKKSGKFLVVATSKPLVYAKRILEHYNLSHFFDIIMGPSLDEKRNTKEEVIEDILKMLPDGSNPVMVGDREQDIIAAKLCNLPSVGVRFGYAEKNELENAGADKIVETVDELFKYLSK